MDKSPLPFDDSYDMPLENNVKANPEATGRLNGQNFNKVFDDLVVNVTDDHTSELEGLGLEINRDCGKESKVQLDKVVQELESVLGPDKLRESINTFARTVLGKDVLLPVIEESMTGLKTWILKNETLPASDLEKYKKQLCILEEVASVYNAPNFDVSSEDVQDAIVEHLCKIHQLGPLPTEVVNDQDFNSPNYPTSLEGFLKSKAGIGNCNIM